MLLHLAGADVGGAPWGRYSSQGAHVEAVQRLVASALAPVGSGSSGNRPSRDLGQAPGEHKEACVAVLCFSSEWA